MGRGLREFKDSITGPEKDETPAETVQLPVAVPREKDGAASA
jgi:hypothetical protein